MDVKNSILHKSNLAYVKLNEKKDVFLSKFPKELNSTNVQRDEGITVTTNLEQAEQDKSNEFKAFLERIRDTLLSINKALEIKIDEELKIPIYKIIDLKTKEVLKQIPLEDILKFKKALAKFLEEELRGKEKLTGILLKKEA